MNPIIKVIIVGLGVRGRHWLHVINNHKLALITAVVDINHFSKDEIIKKDISNIPFFTSLSVALESVESNVVLIVTPPEYHYEQVILAFKRGKHVICEKPLTEELSKSIILYKKSLSYNLKLMVGMNFRYLSTSQHIRNVVSNSELGPIGYANFNYIRNRNGNRKDLNKYPLLMNHPMMLEQSIHHLDLLRYCYMSEVESVQATTWRPDWSTYDNDCCVSIILRFHNKFVVNYLGTWTSGWNKFCFQWRTDFRDGVIIQKDQFSDLYSVIYQKKSSLIGSNFKYSDESEPLNPIALKKDKPFFDDTNGLLNEFISSIRYNKDLDTGVKDYLKTFVLVIACIQSSDDQSTVYLEDVYKKYSLQDICE
jgi:predicted dehydrogenase